MSEILEKTVDSITFLFSPLGTNIGLKSMFERCLSARTKREEECLIQECLNLIRAKLSEPSVNGSAVAKCLTFAVFAHILGYNTEFSHIHAVNLAQHGSLSEKKIGYLACTALLQVSSPLSVLLVNTIVKDLASKNIIIVAMALSSCCQLIPRELMPTVVPLVQEKLSHSSSYVRGKAVIVLHHFYRNCPEHCRYYIGTTQSLLGDKDPGVVALVVQLLVDVVQNSPDILSELTPALVGIHRQIMEKKLPTDFTYKGLTAPWMQISIFRLLRHSKSHDPIVGQLLQETLGACKENLSESMTAALVCECVETLLHHTSGETVLNQAMPLVLQLLHHSNTNIKYAGLCLLEVLLSHYKLPLSLEQQSDIMSGLQHPDHSFRVKTLELLCSAATCSSAHTVSSQVLEYLNKHCQTNVYLRMHLTDLVVKLTDLVVKLTETYPSTENYWHIAALIKTLPLRNKNNSKAIQTKIKTALLGGRDASESIKGARIKVLQFLRKCCESKTASISIVELYVWTYSRFYEQQDDVLNELIALGTKVIPDQDPDIPLPAEIKDLVTQIVEAIGYVCELTQSAGSNVKEFLNKVHSVSKGDGYLRECCTELLKTLPHVNQQLGVDDTMVMDENELDFTLSFMDTYVCEYLEQGGLPYTPSHVSIGEVTPPSSSWDLVSSTNSHSSRSYSLSSDSKELVDTPLVWSPVGRSATPPQDQRLESHLFGVKGPQELASDPLEDLLKTDINMFQPLDKLDNTC